MNSDRYLNLVRTQPPHARFRRFMLNRELARMTKEALGGPGPHSEDPIIAVNRFCNVDREDDTVTKWIEKCVRHQSKTPKHLVPQLLAARIWNHPPTLAALLPIEDCKGASRVLALRRATGEKTMRGAYMMPVHGNNGKGRTVDDYYLAAVSEAQSVDWSTMETLTEVAHRLIQIMGIGDFLANQVCTDMRYTRWWSQAPDVDTFILCGPGTRRGLDRYSCAGKADPAKLGIMQQHVYIKRLLDVREHLRIEKFTLASLFDDPNNLANCFCEFDKYERVLQGEAARLHTYP